MTLPVGTMLEFKNENDSKEIYKIIEIRPNRYMVEQIWDDKFPPVKGAYILFKDINSFRIVSIEELNEKKAQSL